MALALKADHFRNGSCVTSVACPYGKRNFTEDEGGPFEFGNQVPMTSHRKLLSPKAMVMVRAFQRQTGRPKARQHCLASSSSPHD
jgi:hypothetical protein